MAGFHPIVSIKIAKQAVQTYRENFCDKKGFDELAESRDTREENVKKIL